MIKRLVLLVARSLGLFALSRHLTRRSLRILCYHGIWLGPPPHYGDCLFMDAAGFRRRMLGLARKGYRVITLAEGVRKLAEGTLEPRDVVITIDDGWKGTFGYMLPVLRECGFPATLYVATEPMLLGEPLIHLLALYMVERSPRRPAEYATLFPGISFRGTEARHLAEGLSHHVLAKSTPAERRTALDEMSHELDIDTHELVARFAFALMSPEELRQASRQDGIDVQLHTHSHRMHGFAPGKVSEELRLNREHIAQLTNRPRDELVHFCYPSGLFHPSVFPVLREAGIVSATTTEFGLNPPGSDPLALRRILDCNSMTELEIEARLSGFWGIARALKNRLQRARRTMDAAASPQTGTPEP